MLYLIGGPPRVGKTTLAGRLVRNRGISCCPTDLIVSMLSAAAPQLDVHHGTHAHKAASARPFLLEFTRPFASGGDFAMEGDVIDPILVDTVAAAGVPTQAVFLGHTQITIDDLMIEPHWLSEARPAEVERIAVWVRERSEMLRALCNDRDHMFVDMAAGREEGLRLAYERLAGPQYPATSASS